MPTLFFIVPAHGRVEKTRACLRQLARTCDELRDHGLDASAVVVACDENLDAARESGFEPIRSQNAPLGRKWNDGYEIAGRAGADYVVPLGSDDWVDPALMLDELPGPDEIRCSHLSAVVSEDGRLMAPLRINYEGGDGVRVIPKQLLERLRFRPADDDRDRAIDTSIMRKITLATGRPRVRYFDLHPWQIVDWKNHRGGQLNPYVNCLAFKAGPEVDPWETLAAHYPAAALDEMRAVYGLPVKAAA